MDAEITFGPCSECGSERIEVLHARPQSITVRCKTCGAVSSQNPPKQERIIELNTIISDGDRSWNISLPTSASESVAVGDEFEADGHRMIVTGLENASQQNVPMAKTKDITSLFAKVFDTVPLKISCNEGEITRSYSIHVDPDMEVPVGLVIEVQERLLAIKTLKSDQNRTLHKGFLLARNVRRAFCDEAPRRAKPGDVVTTRKRGLSPGEKSKSPAPRTKGPRGQRSRSAKR